MYAETKVTSKYQVTLPKKLREVLEIEKGDRLVFEELRGRIALKVEKRIDPVKAIDGILEGEAIGELKSKAASRMLNKKLGMP